MSIACGNCDTGNPATHTVITLSGELAICEPCYKDQRGRVMREYQVNKIESYSIKANSVEEAEAIVNDLDNSSAYKVDIQTVWAGANQ